MSRASVAGEKVDPGEEKALEERSETFVAGFNKEDIKVMAACYAPDCDFLSTDGQRVKGRDALENTSPRALRKERG